MTLIRCPWPPNKSSPNGSQGDFRGKANAGANYKTTCAWECVAQRVPKVTEPVFCAMVTFHPPRNGKYDLDNALAKIKRGLDAISEHIGVDDSLWQSMRLERGHKVEGGCVMIQIVTQSVENIPFRGVIS